MRAKHEGRIRELEKLLVDFKKNRNDSPGTGLQNSGVVSMMLANFFNGMLSRDVISRVGPTPVSVPADMAGAPYGGGGIRVPQGAGGGFRTGGVF